MLLLQWFFVLSALLVPKTINPLVAKINTQIGVLERHLQCTDSFNGTMEERRQGLARLGQLLDARRRLLVDE